MADIADNVPFTDPATAISQGRRHLLVRDYTMAVTALAQACELLAKKHGDTADELGEPYLLYGRALLGLAREEAAVLGGGVPGSEEAQGEEDDEDEDDEEEEEEDEDEEKLSKVDEKDEQEEEEQEQTEESKKDANETDEASPKKQQDSEKPENADDTKDKEAATKEETEGTSSKQQNGGIRENGQHEPSKEDEEDEVNNLQVAWEVLELAKLVLLKRGPPGWKLLADSYRLLGEVAMEGGNHKGALHDLQGCLNLLEKIEPREPRAIAEIHYQLGLAHSLGNDFDASIEEFGKATTLLESRIKELEAITEPPKTDDPFYTIEGEIQELKDLLPEIREKIADMKDFKQEACKLVIESIRSEIASGSSNGGAGPSSDASSGSGGSGSSSLPKVAKPASDISHLVRKKRKPEESETDVSNPPSKKPTPEKAV